MRYLWIAITGVMVSIAAPAQTWNEWFRQKQTQTQYLVQQIAALKVYLGYLKQGYDIADKGLAIVGNIRDGNFSDHKDFFNSLLRVNPAVRNLPHFKALSGFHANLVAELISMEEICTSPVLTKAERDYVRAVYQNLLRHAGERTRELALLLMDNQFQMSDQERVARITSTYHDLKDLHGFSLEFFNSTSLLIRQREREGVSVEHTINLNDLSL